MASLKGHYCHQCIRLLSLLQNTFKIALILASLCPQTTTMGSLPDSSLDATEFCQSEFFDARCGEDEVVMVTRAQYGRMRINRCVKKNFGYVGCGRDVTSEMDSQCSGRRSCRVRVLDESFPKTQPCHEDLKSYLSVTYKCIRVETSNRARCHHFQTSTLVSTSGFIASIVAEETGCGSADAPWVIKALPGQRINITLYDFALTANQSASQDPSMVCRVYATLRELSSTRSVTVCGGKQRTRHVYTSATEQVQLRILNSKTPSTRIYFLFKYTVLGCPTLKKPQDGWVRHDGESASFGCDSTDQTWTLHCNHTDWIGDAGNCTQVAIMDKNHGGIDLGLISLSFEVSMLVVIILAITVGLTVLALGLYCMRKQAASAEPEGHSAPAHYEINENAPWDSVTAKPIMTTMPPTYQVGTNRRVLPDGTRDNEYASMRLLSSFADICDHENNENTTKIHTSTYGSPQYGRARNCALDTFSATDSGLSSDYGIPYFDEMEAGHTISRQGSLASTVPVRGTKVRLVAGKRGSREVQCSVMENVKGAPVLANTCPHGHTSISTEELDSPRTFVCHPGSHPGKVSV